MLNDTLHLGRYQYPDAEEYKLVMKPDKDGMPEGGTGWVVAEFNGKRYRLLMEPLGFLLKQAERHQYDLDDPEYCAKLDERVRDMQAICLEKLYSELEKHYLPETVLKEGVWLERFSTEGWLTRRTKSPDTCLLALSAEGVTESGLPVVLKGHAVLEQWEITSVEFQEIKVDGRRMACRLSLVYEKDRPIAVFRYGKFGIVMDDLGTADYFALSDTFLGRFIAIQKSIVRDAEFSSGNSYHMTRACVPFTVSRDDVKFRKLEGFPLILDGVRAKLGLPA